MEKIQKIFTCKMIVIREATNCISLSLRAKSLFSKGISRSTTAQIAAPGATQTPCHTPAPDLLATASQRPTMLAPKANRPAACPLPRCTGTKKNQPGEGWLLAYCVAEELPGQIRIIMQLSPMGAQEVFDRSLISNTIGNSIYVFPNLPTYIPCTHLPLQVN